MTGERVEKTLEVRCDERWEQLEGDARERRCEACAEQVFNLSELTAEEAARLLESRAGRRTCARVDVDEAGYAVFKAEARPLPPRLTAAAVALTLPMLLAGCEGGGVNMPGTYTESQWQEAQQAWRTGGETPKPSEPRQTLLLKIVERARDAHQRSKPKEKVEMGIVF